MAPYAESDFCNDLTAAISSAVVFVWRWSMGTGAEIVIPKSGGLAAKNELLETKCEALQPTIRFWLDWGEEFWSFFLAKETTPSGRVQ